MSGGVSEPDRWWGLWKCPVLPALVPPVASTVLMEGTCPNSWVLPRNSGSVVSSYSVFLDSKGDCPQRQGWVAPSTQAGSKTSPSSGLGSASAGRAPASASPPHTHFPVGLLLAVTPPTGSPVLLHLTAAPSRGPLCSGRSQGAQVAAGSPCLPVLPCSRPDPHPEDGQGEDWWKFTVRTSSPCTSRAPAASAAATRTCGSARRGHMQVPENQPLKYLLLGNAEDSPDQSGIVGGQEQPGDPVAGHVGAAAASSSSEKKGKCRRPSGGSGGAAGWARGRSPRRGLAREGFPAREVGAGPGPSAAPPPGPEN